MAKLGFDLCGLDLWPLTLAFCIYITIVSGNNSWNCHDDTMAGTLSKRCGGGGQTVRRVRRAAWSQLNNKLLYPIRVQLQIISNMPMAIFSVKSSCYHFVAYYFQSHEKTTTPIPPLSTYICYADILKHNWKIMLFFGVKCWCNSRINSKHKGQWLGALMFSLICGRVNGWINNHEASDLRHHRVHYDVVAMADAGNKDLCMIYFSSPIPLLWNDIHAPAVITHTSVWMEPVIENWNCIPSEIFVEAK